MSRVCLFVLFLLCCGCASKAKSDPLYGTYIGWVFLDGKAQASDGSKGILMKLTIKPEGHYLFQLESSVMVNMSQKAEGTYTHSANNVSLKGTMTSQMDDGYKKSNHTYAHNVDLSLENGTLVMKNSTGGAYYFQKENTGPPPLPSKL